MGKKYIIFNVITIFIAVFSFLIAGLSFLNSIDFFSSFELDIDTRGTYLIPINNANQLNFAIPIEFLNKGKIEGIVEDVFLMVNHNNKTIRYDALFELDLAKFHSYFCLNGETMIGPFLPFSLVGKSAKRKNLFFFTPNKLDPGDYYINILIKTSEDSIPVVFDSINISLQENDLIDHIENQKTFFYINNEIKLRSIPTKKCDS
tara:strand:+ start:466 stop:1077 length:612 start_codon:yes stop_codon:yes gene_type:complete